MSSTSTAHFRPHDPLHRPWRRPHPPHFQERIIAVRCLFPRTRMCHSENENVVTGRRTREHTGSHRLIRVVEHQHGVFPAARPPAPPLAAPAPTTFSREDNRSQMPIPENENVSLRERECGHRTPHPGTYRVTPFNPCCRAPARRISGRTAPCTAPGGARTHHIFKRG